MLDKLAVKEGSSTFVIKTVGEFKDGKKFDGEFIKLKSLGVFEEISIEKYSQGELLSQSSRQIYKRTATQKEPKVTGFYRSRADVIPIDAIADFILFYNLTMPKKLTLLTSYQDGKKEGMEVAYNENEIVYTANYKNNHLDGVFDLYPNGVLNLKLNVTNGKLNGE
jgi:antitoxin component YwqK of YwqJK toxin-antitoxin module